MRIEAESVDGLMEDAHRLGDAYITALSRYGRASALAEAEDSRPLKVTAYGLQDDAQDAYAAFWRALTDLIAAGHEAYAMRLNCSILTLAGEAQAVAIKRTCEDLRRLY